MHERKNASLERPLAHCASNYRTILTRYVMDFSIMEWETIILLNSCINDVMTIGSLKVLSN